VYVWLQLIAKNNPFVLGIRDTETVVVFVFLLLFYLMGWWLGIAVTHFIRST